MAAIEPLEQPVGDAPRKTEPAIPDQPPGPNESMKRGQIKLTDASGVNGGLLRIPAEILQNKPGARCADSRIHVQPPNRNPFRLLVSGYHTPRRSPSERVLERQLNLP